MPTMVSVTVHVRSVWLTLRPRHSFTIQKLPLPVPPFAVARKIRLPSPPCRRFTPSMVSMQDIKQYCDAIAAAFKPQRIILFGSHARGEPGEDSDVDVLVVMPKSRRAGRATAIKIREKVDADFPVDVLVRGEKEVERRVRERDLFMTHVTREGRVMYEAVNA